MHVNCSPRITTGGRAPSLGQNTSVVEGQKITGKIDPGGNSDFTRGIAGNSER